MHYIILDMEWDSAYSPQHKRFINQIIQIGGVKLDESFETVDTFEVTVKSSFSKKVSKRFAELTGINTEKMLSGVPLIDAVENYNRWIGEDTVTMTWSNSDLFSIIENENFLLDGHKFRIEKYLDLQKFIQNELKLSGHELNSQIALAAAAELAGITVDDLSLHTAKDDCLVCAALIKKYYNKERFDRLVRDTADPEFYARLCYKPIYIDNIKSKDIDKKQLKFNCDICGAPAERCTKWHYRNRWFVAEFRCKKCKRRFSGRVSFKKNYDDIVIKRRICELKQN